MSKAPKTNILALHNFLSATKEFNFELTNYCNISCIYCDNKRVKNKGYLTIANFKKIVDTLFIHGKSHKKVIFCGFGEPFLNNEIYEMIDYISDMGVCLNIQTNGKWHLNENKIGSLFKVNRISVTIDSVTNDILELSRPNTDVHTIFNTLKRIIDLKEQFSKDTPAITAKMNVFTFNKHQTHDLIHKCLDYKFDKVSLAKGSGPPEVVTTISKSEHEKYNSDNIDIDNSLFDVTTNHQCDCNLPDHNKKNISNTITSQPAKLFQTLGCFDTATIKWDGSLVPCCWDIESQLLLGNLVTDKLEDIFTSENLNKVGRKILNSRSNPFSKIPCLNCSKFTSHFQLGVPVLTKRFVIQSVFKAYQGLHRFCHR